MEQIPSGLTHPGQRFLGHRQKNIAHAKLDMQQLSNASLSIVLIYLQMMICVVNVDSVKFQSIDYLPKLE